ncbi:hypothetical protein MZD04_gp343 [Pseudomonas phage Psa21]|uniref:Uncharacterized protein n=1 Tax=Pseudomonas phage Psa21 TaxID=2530023 RepID=A0A481W4S5_9CAUD|nr:hypothetical protein MZD04_gp343 [Pseudomonas phage Psa21]QBJ02869.1 hypothetical protein PSA21_343 [Pseudomonas phage Psa21]
MSVSLKESGLLDQLIFDRDEIVCCTLKDLEDDYTKEKVTAALDEVYNRTVGNTLATLNKNGFYTIADAIAGTIGDVVSQDSHDEWINAINT